MDCVSEIQNENEWTYCAREGDPMNYISEAADSSTWNVKG